MDIQATKIELAKLILSLDNPSIIEKISKFIKIQTKDFWFELSKYEQQEIKEGLELLNRGERISLEDFLKKVK
ncbi:MAG: hypothetical protein HOD63_03950 [Bacteroidetes bacterium]|jgi:hypothetical protein|nr:hypothetical protein [Bacteroidota bacterium]MBT5531243.1 hypothetical protein [Cytophagia bacterium]MBT3424408.1 hypothetical protein [Bacteroidota bacterium]MBT3800174.1 hypothetical protein [Bacteroidota bacterium]MBT3933632.1 hypothetical protein [Bacteroidota bacterium]